MEEIKKEFNKLNWSHDIDKIKFLLTKAKQDCGFLFKPKESGLPEKRLFSYKWLLSDKSPVFQKMFDGMFVESSVSAMDIEIIDVSFEAFELFLDYLYYGTNNVRQWPETYWSELFYIADKYMIPKMSEDLQHYAALDEDNITTFNRIKDGEIFRRIEFREDVLMDPRLGDMELIRFLKFLKGLDFNYEQINKFKLIQSYVMQKRYDPNETQPSIMMTESDGRSLLRSSHEIVQQLLTHVRFDEMSVNDFMNGPDLSNLLSIEKKYSILRKIVRRQRQE